MKIKILLLLFMTILCVSQTHAQRKIRQMDSDKQAQEDERKEYERPTWRDKIFFGGNAWASFGNTFSYFYVAPVVGYRILPKTAAGVGVTYYYISQKYINPYNNLTETYDDNIYGFNVFGRQTLFGPVFAHAEFQTLNYTTLNRYVTGADGRIWVNSVFVGGGVNQSISGKNGGTGPGISIFLLYDLLYNSNTSLYASPIVFRAGFYF